MGAHFLCPRLRAAGGGAVLCGAVRGGHGHCHYVDGDTVLLPGRRVAEEAAVHQWIYG